jgi:phenolic acid decarboxylase
MGEYANIKFKQILRFAEWLSKHPDITIRYQGNHQLLIKYAFGKRPFPIPRQGNEVNRHIVKGLVNVLIKEWEVCNHDDVDQFLK